MATEGYPEDDQFEDTAVSTAEPADGGGWYCGFDTGYGFFVPAISPVAPVPGMPARFYGKGLGFTVRGLFLDGRRVFYRTEAEQAAEDARRATEHEQAERYDFERERADLDRRYAALPAAFRARLDRFRRGAADFRWKFEKYELFCCEQALAIAGAFRGEADPAAALDAFRGLPWEQQLARVPALSDDHSGNTFGFACRLAYLSLARPDLVAREHGALTPLVGCREYGCTHPQGDPAGGEAEAFDRAEGT